MHLVAGGPHAAQVGRPQTGGIAPVIYAQSGPIAYTTAGPAGFHAAAAQTMGSSCYGQFGAFGWGAYQQPQVWMQPTVQQPLYDLGSTAGVSGPFAFGGGPLAGTYLHMADVEKVSESEGIQLQDLKDAIGIASPEDEELYGWIAEYGLQDDALPPGWSRHTDVTSGSAYYANEESETTVWENPLIPHLKHVIDTSRAYLQTPSDSFFEEQKVLLWHHHKEELDDWHGPLTDNESRSYFVNSSDGVSSYQDPRERIQYIFELECCLLDRLQEVLPAPPPVTIWDDSPGTGPGQRSNTGETVSSPNRPTRRASQLAQQAGIFDHRSTFQSMSNSLSWFRETRGDEAEKQRHHFTRKVAARKMRLQLAAAKEGFGAGGRRPPPLKDVASASPHAASLVSGLSGANESMDKSKVIELDQSVMRPRGQVLLGDTDLSDDNLRPGPLSPTLQSLPGGFALKVAQQNAALHRAG
mmetsp:Transcript_52102/g.124088  ORF Transcript_52102/g.124088 Transcript_52102/m.124088 type:complete len:468 (-) Transcript_52102:76-1479(-)|eukprot:CAMPEP_0178391974 /NCGR_PEP_ID=MMETSP0689_2-20121128/11442_1 /TAXON_ID=160604 /ORGANISM="Amphidinium massartii, Strain CS-259" /LENGTH=467 /DNA_ID=CAMNT_0020012539 /DNA_START=90 /DNA_END=1493 /DNA_ORIENTATION=+